MAITRSNFEPVSNLLQNQTRSIALLDPTLADPLNALALVDGEWCVVDANKKLARAADISSGGNAATAPSYPVWDEKGRTDNQALGGRNKTVIYLGSWEFDTDVFLVASMVHNGLVAVSSITIDSVIYSGLVANGTFGTPGAGITVGVITRLPSTNNGRLRIRGGMHF